MKKVSYVCQFFKTCWKKLKDDKNTNLQNGKRNFDTVL